MRSFTFAVSASLLLASAASAAPAATDILGPQKSPAEIEAARLAQFKLDPIAKVAQEGRTLRRVTYADIYQHPAAPAVILEKLPTGEVEMTVVSYSGKLIDKATLKPEAWAFVAAKEAQGLAPRKPFKASDQICVGNSVVVESAQSGKAVRREGEVCNGAVDLATMEYARAVARVAVTSIPRCAGYVENTRDDSWTLRDCLRRSLVSEYRKNPYNSSSGDNKEAFTSWAIKTSNNLTSESTEAIVAESRAGDLYQGQ